MASETKRQLICAIYTRKSSEEGLEQEFNSLDAQREACEAFVLSQRHEGWKVSPTQYNDGGFSGGNMERPGLVQLLADIRAERVDVVVVYKVDRLTRSLSDFAKIVETFDSQGVSFVSVTQQFNTTTSMGRLTLNVLLSFAQFEREVTGERIRDKIAASRRKGMWMGGTVPLGYDLHDQRYVINEQEAAEVRTVYELYLEVGSVPKLQGELKRRGMVTKRRISKSGKIIGGKNFHRGHVYYLLNNRTYLGEAVHRGTAYPGLHEPIISLQTWEKVQALLNENRQTASLRANAKHPSLLKGVLFDDRGNRLSPTHSTKRGVRKRYYVSQAILQNKPDLIGQVKRVPAQLVEDLLLGQLRSLLSDPLKLCVSLSEGEYKADMVPQVEAAAKKLLSYCAEPSAVVTRKLVRLIVTKMTIGVDVVEIEISKAALTAELKLKKLEREVSDESQSLKISVPVRLKRTGRETKLLLGQFEYNPKDINPNEGMIRALKNAHVWNAQFLAGKSTADIAHDEKRHRGYVAAVIPLAFLAPDITEAILAGRQPASLKTKKLLRHVPFDWNQQRQVFGFSEPRLSASAAP